MANKRAVNGRQLEGGALNLSAPTGDDDLFMAALFSLAPGDVVPPKGLSSAHGRSRGLLERRALSRPGARPVDPGESLHLKLVPFPLEPIKSGDDRAE